MLLKDLFHVFFPSLCVNCSSKLVSSEQFLCTLCLSDLPIIRHNEATQKILQSIFYGKVPIEQIYSFLYYSKFGITQKLIHELKYKNQPDIGVFLGKWINFNLRKLHMFTNIDYVVPVPLHPTKKKKRGYNQVTKFGKTLSEALNAHYKPNILVRKTKMNTQTFKQRFERFSTTKSTFEITNEQFFINKHILLIDDVITTGATLVACCNELLKTQNIKISICTMAYTESG